MDLSSLRTLKGSGINLFMGSFFLSVGQLWFVFCLKPFILLPLLILGGWVLLFKLCPSIAHHPTLRGVNSLRWECQAMSNLRFELGLVGVIHLSILLATLLVHLTGASMSFWLQTGFTAVICLQFGWILSVLEKYLALWTSYESCEELKPTEQPTE